MRGEVRAVRIEVKAKTGDVYTLNDTFPDPRRRFDEVYVLFSVDDKRVVVSTGATMAEAARTRPSIFARRVEAEKARRAFQRRLERTWRGTDVYTAARPTYRIPSSYAHKRARVATLARLFREGDLKP